MRSVMQCYQSYPARKKHSINNTPNLINFSDMALAESSLRLRGMDQTDNLIKQ